MQAIITFIKTTVLGAVVVIVPMAVIAFVITDIFTRLVTITAPLTKNMVFGPIGNALIVMVLGILVIVLVFFVAGLLLNSIWGEKIKTGLKARFLKTSPCFQPSSN